MRWQLSHAPAVEMWFVDFPRAWLPLWQVAHVPGATPEWVKLAGAQAVVRWQLSQFADVWTWLADLPRAWLPLWHDVHEPAATRA